MTRSSRLATGALVMMLAFEAAAAPATKKIEVTKEQKIYRNVSGNEFTMIFTSSTAPKGVEVKIDPDDTLPMIDPRTGKFYVQPRLALLLKINAALPSVPGGPSLDQLARMEKGPEAVTVDPDSVGSIFYHLKFDHKVPEKQIWKAVDRSAAIRHQEPQFRHLPLQTLFPN